MQGRDTGASKAQACVGATKEWATHHMDSPGAEEVGEGTGVTTGRGKGGTVWCRAGQGSHLLQCTPLLRKLVFQGLNVSREATQGRLTVRDGAAGLGKGTLQIRTLTHHSTHHSTQPGPTHAQHTHSHTHMQLKAQTGPTSTRKAIRHAWEALNATKTDNNKSKHQTQRRQLRSGAWETATRTHPPPLSC